MADPQAVIQYLLELPTEHLLKVMDVLASALTQRTSQERSAPANPKDSASISTHNTSTTIPGSSGYNVAPSTKRTNKDSDDDETDTDDAKNHKKPNMENTMEVTSESETDDDDRITAAPQKRSYQSDWTTVKSRKTRRNYPEKTQTLQPPKPQTTASHTAPQERNPPIILRDRADWIRLHDLMEEQNAFYTTATNVKDGIKIIFPSIQDYKRTLDICHKTNPPFQIHTFSTEEERELHIVIRGTPTEIPIEKVHSELKDLGYHPLRGIIRMIHPRTKRDMPLIKVVLPKEETNIYKITEICGLRATVEALIKNPKVMQCHRCQIFGHGSSRCTAQAKCVKCAGLHLTAECTTPHTHAPKCANCGAAHVANYRGCPMAPLSRKPNTIAASARITAPASQTNTNYPTLTRPKYTMAQAVKSNPPTALKPTAPQHPAPTPNLRDALMQFNQLYEQMSQLALVIKSFQ